MPGSELGVHTLELRIEFVHVAANHALAVLLRSIYRRDIE